MQASKRRQGVVLAVFVICFLAILTLSLAGTAWAAPNAQGTVPTAERPTDKPPDGGGGGGGGDNGGNNGGNDNGGDKDKSGDISGGLAPPVLAPGNGAVCAIGDTGAQCTGDSLIVGVGAGAAPAGAALTIEGSFGQPPCPASAAGQNFLNRCYRYTWIGTNAEPLGAINAPVQYCIAYGQEQLATTNNNPQELLIGLAAADGNWTLVKPSVDTAGGHVCATSNEVVTWSALFAPQSASKLLPTVGAEMYQWWMVPLAAFGILLLVGAWRLSRKPI